MYSERQVYDYKLLTLKELVKIYIMKNVVCRMACSFKRFQNIRDIFANNAGLTQFLIMAFYSTFPS